MKMINLDDLKKKWDDNQQTLSGDKVHNSESLEKIFKSRIKKHVGLIVKYFWATFFLHILVYALLSYVMIKYAGDTEILYFSIGTTSVFVPFTFVLLQKFKRMARINLGSTKTETSLFDTALQQHDILLRFYKFKKRYELLLIPMGSAIGTIITFKLYVPGGVFQYPVGALITFALTIISCVMVSLSENKKSFEQPLHQLKQVIDEFKRDDV